MKYKPIIWDVEHAENRLGDKLCDALLAIHTFLGCNVHNWKSHTFKQIHGQYRVWKTSENFVVFRPPTLIPTSSNVKKTLD